MNFQVAPRQSYIRPNAERLHVLPHTKDRIFAETEVERFEASSQNYLDAYDQVGRTGAARGVREGALVCGALGLAIVAGATLPFYGDVVGMALGATLGTAIAGTFSAVFFPAAVDGNRWQAQDKFAYAHPAPYLQNGPDRWLTADGHLVHDINGQTHGRLS